ncbi:EAL domain-containing protein [Legionella taurinensis]|uniref:Diguanylate phosphodiesterase n=1 Tax=Legionella taurinensis TaxID=70611 RepID=A0A3A5L9L4_9GAMM|nr:EAL domain-containing protein [Legionella taurinensis]MDX1838303.1 EAL domain-containing protein [Legionella taurinensis]PUT39209.1 diguanylate phosphodiesterase [Legionella taurinensis]PUT39522.1 diguanylate phosphodiesterase [Legionella taurinensis]PUT43975.1 diguanylate phosphodiesterase [Legionella taurinensis]PUT45025.1 diguanylate phosphodiesterase [Legionella taurinensis]
MINDIHSRQLSAQQTLTISWFLLSLIVLFLALFYEWRHYREARENQMELIAKERAFQFDEFMENLIQGTFALNFTRDEFNACQTQLLPVLTDWLFNNPNVSAIAITDPDGKTTCSTLNLTPPVFFPASAAPHLHGPFDSGHHKQPTYLLQQKLGQYHFTLYILRSIFENLLRPLEATSFKAIALYDTQHKKQVFQLTQRQPDSSPEKSMMLRIPSQTLDDYQLLFTAKGLVYEKHFIYTELIIAAVVILLSLFLYYLLRKALNRRFSLDYALQNGLRQGHFEPMYQPVVDVANNRFCGAEVLIRWQMDAKQTIMPDLFIEEAEASGLIVPMTLQLVEKSFQQCAELLSSNNDFHLAFNVSVNHFLDRRFFPQFYQLCEQYGVNNQQIILELTERQLFNKEDKDSMRIMQDLRERGYSLAIDDFGTGHASIHYLQHLPFNYLKIDKLFIQAIGTGAITETLNQAIINMANSLDLAIIAEGVETMEQYDYLRRHRVDYIQGWYFARAMTIEQLITFIEEKANEAMLTAGS